MDYSRHALEKKAGDLAASSRIIEKRAGIIALRVLFTAVLLAVTVAVFGAAGMISGIIASAPPVGDINISPSGFATFIYDSEGSQLQKLTSSNSNRTAVSIENVPVDLRHAVVAIEDERFYEHNGIDIRGIARAAVVGLRNRFRFTEGASTITQQLLKNNVFTDWTEERTLIDRIRRKFQEQYLAVKLEERLKNKDLILENYLNTINLGAGTYGVEAASKKYFDKHVWELDLSECAVLAGITKNPARYNPIRNPEENAARRERVLTKMVEQGYISEEEKDAALSDPVYERIQKAQQKASGQDTVYSYFVDALTEQVVTDLQAQKGYTENQAYQMLFSGGLRIYTTQDRKIQKICDEEYSDPANFPKGTEYALDWALTVKKADGTEKNYSREMLRGHFQESDASFDLLFSSEAEGKRYISRYKRAVLEEGDEVVAEKTEFVPQPQSSLVIMDQHTGYVKAIEGGRGKKTASLTLNRAVGTRRQPGSTFKILSVYAPALDTGRKSLASYIEDKEFAYVTGENVRNADGNYRGWITVREAIRDSVNVVAVKILTELTPQAGYDQLLKFGITSLDPNRDIVQPLALGGISRGVSNLELTAAYASIANEGNYIKPVFYTKILDQDGSVIIDNTPETRRTVSRDTAWLLTNAMEDVVKKGTATAVQLDSGMPVAGKTGTTNDYRNVWFAGYTPYYTMGIWGGYDSNAVLPEEDVFREYHKTLWKKVMERVTEGMPVTEFRKPADVEQVEICGLSGMKPGEYCEFTGYDYVAAEYRPARRCTLCGSGYEDYDYYHEYEEWNGNADGGDYDYEDYDETVIPAGEGGDDGEIVYDDYWDGGDQGDDAYDGGDDYGGDDYDGGDYDGGYDGGGYDDGDYDTGGDGYGADGGYGEGNDGYDGYIYDDEEEFTWDGEVVG